ncbi:MAG: DUF302 domain-containing protein [Syntrophobacterales bacterium]|jgi:uncharacterized protein (DUF302 family)|nr:DUF302 domain-containing protein [Syntrophobacterales bacterium]
MERSVEVDHVSLEINADFEGFTRTLEQFLPRFDDVLLDELETDPKLVEERLKEAAGEEDLMLFTVYDHGKLLNIYGALKKARQYVLGNPLIAAMMTRHDIRAGLYAPLRLLVYEADDRTTHVEFDQPSSLFGQFNNPEVTAVAQSLDTKLASLIKQAEERSGGNSVT